MPDNLFGDAAVNEAACVQGIVIIKGIYRADIALERGVFLRVRIF